MHTVLRKNSLNGSVLQQALHYYHIGMGSILLLQFSYCHTYKISPQNYKKNRRTDISVGKFSSPQSFSPRNKVFLTEKQLVSHRGTNRFTPGN